MFLHWKLLRSEQFIEVEAISQSFFNLYNSMYRECDGVEQYSTYRAIEVWRIKTEYPVFTTVFANNIL